MKWNIIKQVNVEINIKGVPNLAISPQTSWQLINFVFARICSPSTYAFLQYWGSLKVLELMLFHLPKKNDNLSKDGTESKFNT